jgi:hypothetical protein
VAGHEAKPFPPSFLPPSLSRRAEGALSLSLSRRAEGALSVSVCLWIVCLMEGREDFVPPS